MVFVPTVHHTKGERLTLDRSLATIALSVYESSWSTQANLIPHELATSHHNTYIASTAKPTYRRLLHERAERIHLGMTFVKWT
jgi:hypothetical protein